MSKVHFSFSIFIHCLSDCNRVQSLYPFSHHFFFSFFSCVHHAIVAAFYFCLFVILLNYKRTRE